MFGWSLDTVAIVWAGAFLGAIAAGGAGFAFALAASSIWLHALDPVHTTAFVVASGVLLHAGFVWSMRRRIEPARLWPFVAGCLAGIPIGAAILTHTDGGALKAVLGGFLLVYGTYALLAPRLPVVTGGGRGADAAVGFAGGILGGIGGYSGVLPTVWTQLRGWPKDVARSVYQPYILVAQLATLMLVGAVAFDRAATILFASAVPALGLGAWIGWLIYGRLDERRFKQVLSVMLIASGLGLVI